MVSTVPSGAEIRTPSGLVAVSPAGIPTPLGGLPLTVTAEGYLPLDTTIFLGDSTVVLYLDMPFEVLVTSDPGGSEVLLDGESRGRTPVRIQVPRPGRHVLEAVSAGGVTATDTLILAGAREHEVRFTFPSASDRGLVYVPPAMYRAGAGGGDPSIVRDVALSGYFLSAAEVTNSEFCLFLNSIDPFPSPDTIGREGMSALLSELFRCDYPLDIVCIDEGYAVREGLESCPVRGVSWSAAARYCDWLTLCSGGGYRFRLPTEAEWEYAATAGDGRTWPWGEAGPANGMLNCSDVRETIASRSPGLDDGFSETSPVMSFPPNPWGFYDMSGNVWEWCSDWAGGEGASTFHGQDSIRCLRGGSWLSSPGDCTCFSRLGLSFALGYPFAGFRVAADGIRPAPRGGASGVDPDAGL